MRFRNSLSIIVGNVIKYSDKFCNLLDLVIINGRN